MSFSFRPCKHLALFLFIFLTVFKPDDPHSRPSPTPSLLWFWPHLGRLLCLHVAYFFPFCLLGPHPQHMEVPRLEVESAL